MRYVLFVIITVLYCQIAQAQTVVFVPQWSAQSQFAGYYTAIHKDFYKENGLDVEIIHPSMSENSISFLKDGRAQFITMTLSQALYWKMMGVDLVNVMQTSQNNSHMLVGHVPLSNPKVLQGKKIAVLSYLNTDLVKSVIAKYGVSPRLVRYNSGVNVFLSKAVDVCLMVSYNEYLQLEECGFRTDPANVVYLSQWGYNIPEDGVYVLRTYYDNNKDAVRRFVQASIRGWNYVVQNPNEALEISMQQVEKNKVATSKYHQRQMLKEVLRLQVDPQSSIRSYKMSKVVFDSALKFFPSMTLNYDEFVK